MQIAITIYHTKQINHIDTIVLNYMVIDAFMANIRDIV